MMNFFNPLSSMDPGKATSILKLNSAADFPDFEFQTQAVALTIGDPAPAILSGASVIPVVIAAGAGDADAIAARQVEIDKWKDKNHKLYYYLVMNTGPKVRPLVSGIPAGGSRQVWIKLCSVFQGDSITTTAQNISKIVRLKMTGELMLYVESISRMGTLLTANIAALAARNEGAAAAGRHAHTIEELIQIAVLLNGLPRHFDPIVQAMWLRADLNYDTAVHALFEFNDRYMSDPVNAARARQAEVIQRKVEEAMAASALNAADTNITITPNAAQKTPKIVIGTDNKTGDKVPMLCTHCSGTNHMVDACYLLFPELRVQAHARRKARDETRRISKGVSSGAASGGISAKQASVLEEDDKPMPWQSVNGFASTFGAFNVEVLEEGQLDESIAPAGVRDLVWTEEVAGEPQVVYHTFIALVDSGATCNFVNSLEFVHDYQAYSEPKTIILANGEAVDAYGCGEVGVFKFMYVPDLKRNIVSVGFMATEYHVGFDLRSGGRMYDATDGGGEDAVLYGKIVRDHRLFYVQYPVFYPTVPGGSVPTHWEATPEGVIRVTPGPELDMPSAFLVSATEQAFHAAIGPPAAEFTRWVVDSGATNNFATSMKGVEDFNGADIKQVRIANGAVLESQGSGMLNGKMPVVYMPQFANNLCSVSAMADQGIGFKLGRDKCIMYSEKTGEALAPVHRVGNSYYVDIPVKAATRSSPPDFGWIQTLRANNAEAAANSTPNKTALRHLHEVFHTSHSRLLTAVNGKHLAGHGITGPVKEGDFEFDCIACMLSKHNQPARIAQDKHKRSTVPYELIHIDSEPMQVPTWEGHMVATFIVDDCTNTGHVLTCHSRDDQVALIEKFCCQTVSGVGFEVKKIATMTRNIRLDGAGEFTGAEFNSMLTRIKANAQYTLPYTPQQNGRVERKIQVAIKGARALGQSASLPAGAWGEMLKTAIFLDNRLPTSANPGSMSPLEMLTGKAPNIEWLQPIGTLCTVHHGPRRGGTLKSDANSSGGMLVGFSLSSRRYRICTDLRQGTIIETDKVVFLKKPQALVPVPRATATPHGVSWELDHTLSLMDEPQEPDTVPPAAPVAPVIPGADGGNLDGPQGQGQQGLDREGPAPNGGDATVTRSGRVSRQAPRFAEEYAYYATETKKHLSGADETDIDAVCACYASDLGIIAEACAAKIPYREAEKDPRLVTSMVKELKHLFDSNAVELTPLPPGRKAIGVTWAHKFKHDENNEPTYAKSRICPQGFSQVEGVDYNPDEVAAPTVNMTSVFLMLALTVHLDMYTGLYDVDAAFTIPPLKEDVYMKIPQGLEKIPGHALKLKTSLNGLKQSAFNWHSMAARFIVSQGFKATVVDPCLYWRRVDDKFAMIALYVDDFRTAFQSQDQKATFEANMDKAFPIKKLTGDFYLGMQVIHDREKGTISISHKAYITNMLKDFHMFDCKPVDTPAAPGTKLQKSTQDSTAEMPVDEVAFAEFYRGAVGATLWVARTTIPEMMYAVCQCSSHCASPDSTHVTAIKRCFRYAKAKMDTPLVLHRGEGIELVCYSDADYCGEPELSDKPMKSLSGLVIGLKGIGFLQAQSSLQTTVSRSTAEAEYRAGGTACQVVLGLRNQLEELGFKQEWPTTIYGDNEACIKMFKSAVSGSALRHIKLDHHFVREHVAAGEIKMVYIPTEEMVADIMTKALPRAAFHKHADAIRNGNL